MVKQIKNFFSWLSSRVGLQALSVLIALIAWVFVNAGQGHQDRRNLKLQFVQMPTGLAFQRMPIREVMIDLSGPLYKLRSLQDDDLVYLVDLSTARTGVNRFEIDPHSLRLPSDIQASRPSPKVFQVILEEMIGKEVPLKPVFLGSLRPGLMVSGVNMNPSSVAVSGPRSMVSKLSEMEVVIPLNGKTSSFSLTVEPKVNFPEIELNQKVTVVVDISGVKETKEFKDVPVALVDTRKDIFFKPMTGIVMVEGPPGELQRLSKSIKIRLETRGLKRGRYLIRAQVDLPQNTRLISVEPRNFMVEVTQ